MNDSFTHPNSVSLCHLKLNLTMCLPRLTFSDWIEKPHWSL